MKKQTKQLTIPTLRRLPNYYHIICQAHDAGEKYISSAKMSEMLDIDDTQVRKDIAATGYVGKPKVGFDVSVFKKHLEDFLGFNNTRKAILVGAGNLGIALAKYNGFDKFGLDIAAVFDNDPQKIGIKVANREIFPLSKLSDIVTDQEIKMAILTIPGEYAQDVTDVLVKAGIKGILNFAPASLKVPEDVTIQNQDLAASFVTLSLLMDK